MGNCLSDIGFFQAVMLLLLFLIAIIDIKHQYIPISLLIALLTGGLLCIALGRIDIFNAIGAGLMQLLLLGILHLGSKKSIGLGDVLLCSIASLYLGVAKAFEMMFIAILLCGVAALLLLLINKSNKDRLMPLAPFVLLGAFIALAV